MRILIAEDDGLHRSYLRDVAGSILPDLEEVVEADDGKAALELFKQGEFHSVILDMQMPDVTGVEAAKEIWRIAPDTRVLFWSNYAEEAYVRGITKIVPDEAVYGYILKSASEERLRLALQGVFIGDQCVIDREVRGIQRRARDRVAGLSELEYEALVDLSLGLTDKAMAARRNVSLRGVQGRLQQLYIKLGLDKSEVPTGSWGASYNTRTRAITLAFARGLINADALRREEIDLQQWIDKTSGIT
jgi:DNA-binding NarL/FixJ family response regulator